jgi:hypothetical protein
LVLMAFSSGLKGPSTCGLRPADRYAARQRSPRSCSAHGCVGVPRRAPAPLPPAAWTTAPATTIDELGPGGAAARCKSPARPPAGAPSRAAARLRQRRAGCGSRRPRERESGGEERAAGSRSATEPNTALERTGLLGRAIALPRQRPR